MCWGVFVFFILVLLLFQFNFNLQLPFSVIFADIYIIMGKTKKKSRLSERYRFAIINDRTFRELWNKVMTLRSFVILIVVAVVFLIGGGAALIIFTPLRQYVPGYPNSHDRDLAISNYLKVDSLERLVSQNDLYINNLRDILNGHRTNPHVIVKDSIKQDEKKRQVRIDTIHHTIDDDQFNVRYIEDETVLPTVLSTIKMHFYCPLKGDITNPHSPETGHYGIDIVSNAKDPILSVLDGTVIMAGWTLEAGYVIIVQHRNNIISQYKHNSFLLKKIGDHVRAGEPLGIIGNTGEYTTGPHLHFELWQNGTPLNPTDYIIF